MKKPRILVVEDEKVVAADITQCMRKLGYTVVGTAAGGVEALRKAVASEPDLVLMDIKLRGSVDGVDAAEQLHRSLGIPVVYLTAYADVEILERAKKTAPSGYVLKPFDDRTLRSAVEIALHRHRMERRLVEGERRLSAAIRSIDEAVIITQGSGLVTLINGAAESLTGWRKEEALGRHAADLFTTVHGETGVVLPSPLGRVAAEDIAVNLSDQAVLVSRQGARTRIQGHAAPLHDEEHRLVGIALIFRPTGAQGARRRVN